MHKYIKVSPNFHIILNKADRFRTELNIEFSSGGAYFEKDHQKGLTHLLEHTQLNATKKYSKKELNRLLFEKDIYRNASTSIMTEGITMSGHKDDFNEMLDLILDFAFEPTLDQSIVDLEKQIVLREITERKGNPGYRLSRFIFESVYQKGSKELLEVLGDAKIVENATIDGLMEIHKRILEESHFVISAVGGGIDEAKLIKDVEELSLRFGAEKTHPIDMDGQNKFLDFKYKPIVSDLAHEQSIIIMFMPCTVNFGNRAIRDIAWELLFSYPEGVFYKIMREELGLLYSIDGSFDESLQMLAVRMSGEIVNAKKLVEEASKILLNPEKFLSEKDLEVIKNLQIKRQEISSDNPYAPVEFLSNTLLNYGVVEELSDYIEDLKSISFEDIKAFGHEIANKSSESRIVVVSKNSDVNDLELKV